MEINASSSVCRSCGKAYGRLKGYFPVSYATLYKAVGYLPYCNECVDKIYDQYFNETRDEARAAKQLCRKMDIYWNEPLFDAVAKKSAGRSLARAYIAKTNSINLAGKSYDDTIREAGNGFIDSPSGKIPGMDYMGLGDSEGDDGIEISEEIIAFWGPGYTPRMYFELQERYDFLVSELSKDVELDVGTKTVLRQIAAAELDINKDRAAGKSVDKKQTALNTLLNNSLLKPAQKSDQSDVALESTPLGVWIRRWENQRPIPEPDPELKDVDGIIRYIEVWFKGHLSKMLNIKNTYSKMYEDELNRLRIDRPEYEDDDDETLFNDIFGDTDSEEE